MSGNVRKLRDAANSSEARATAGSDTSRAISADLRRLQAGREPALDLAGIIAGLVGGLSALLADDRFVSLSRTRDGRAVRLSVKDGGEWIEFYSADPDHAEELGEGLSAAFGAGAVSTPAG
jgi:hypothetical protein